MRLVMLPRTMIRRCRDLMLVCLCCLVVPMVASAQTYSYSSVIVDGNDRIDDESVLRFAGLPKSGTATLAQLNSAYRGIADSRLFEDISIEPQGRNLVITVAEYPTINQISIEGNKRLDDEVLSQLVTSKPRHVYNPSQAEEDAAAIADVYRVSGRYAATVTPKIIRRSDNRVDLVFEVFEGRVIETERIGFVGNDVYSSSRLRRVLSSKQAGIFRAIMRTDTYIAERIEHDKALLDEFYKSRGYLDFEVLSVTSELTTERDAFFLVFTIREGQMYRFGQTTASTDLKDVDADEYLLQSRISSGEIYSPKLVQDAVRRMEFLAVKQNLPFVRARPMAIRNDVERTVDIEFRLEKGSRVFVERIEIAGNSTTYDRVIRREFDIAEGDPFNQREVDEAAARIRRLGHFSAVDVTTVAGSSPDLVVILVRVEETLTGSLSFGATYSKDDGIAGTINLSESNVLGRGQYLSFGISTGDDRSYELTFVEPYFLDRDVEFRLDTSYVTTNASLSQYSTTQWNIEPSIRFKVSETSRLRVGVGLSSYKLGKVITNSFVINEDLARGKGDNVSTRYVYDYDSRRSAFNPDIGISFTGSQRLTYGTSDDSVALRSTALIGGYTTILNEDVTLSAELEGGVLVTSGGPSRLRDRFHMHSGIMRGFAGSGIGPRDFGLRNVTKKAGTYDDDGDGTYTPGEYETRTAYGASLGGNYFAAARLESRFPLGASEDVGISGGLFLDFGSIWGLDDKRCSNYRRDTDGKAVVIPFTHRERIKRDEVDTNAPPYKDKELKYDDNDYLLKVGTKKKDTYDEFDYWTKDVEHVSAETVAAACVIDDGMKLRSAVGFSLFWTSFLGPFRFNFSHDLMSEAYDTPQSFNIELASQF